MTRIELHIDKLVLRGIDRADAKAVSAGVQAELRRLLADPGAVRALHQSGDRLRIKAAPAQIPAGTAGRDTGQHIAASIVSGVKS